MIKAIPKSEQTALDLASLYGSYGFRRYKVGCFENYAEYLESKNFMPSEQVITFGGKDGKLLALKPDITMSIVKNVNVESGDTEKLFYKENVFRTLTGSGDFKEIAQMGVEIIGDIDDLALTEFATLALKSLSLLSGDYLLDLCHIGFVEGLLDYCKVNEGVRPQILTLLSERNKHGLTSLFNKDIITLQALTSLTELIDLSGSKDALLKAKALIKNQAMQNAYNELSVIVDNLSADENMRIDFTVNADFNYYSGLVCKGYVAGIPRPVLSGGRYDKMASRLKKGDCGAIGFAVYLGELYGDKEVLKPCYLIYDENAPVKDVIQAAETLRKQGLPVKTAKKAPDNGFNKLFMLKDGTIKEIDGDTIC